MVQVFQALDRVQHPFSCTASAGTHLVFISLDLRLREKNFAVRLTASLLP